MSTNINLKFMYDDDDDKEKKEENNKEYFDIDTDVKNEFKLIQNKEKVFIKLWRLYNVSDKFFIIINFTLLIFSIFTESSLSLALSIYTLSFSIVFDARKYLATLEKLIILYQDEIIPEVNKCMRKYRKNNCDNCSDIVYELQQIEKDILNKYLGIYFSIPKKLRSVDWKRSLLIFFIYLISFTSLAVICYLKPTII